MQSRSPQPLRDNQKFKSGVSIGSGMTYKLDSKNVNGITYMDTPGLDDVEMRKEAAEAITGALKKNGQYQVFFVVTLEAGRVKPADVATILLILESAPEITQYGVIFNKLGKQVLLKLDKENSGKMALLTQVTAQYVLGRSKRLPYPFFLPRINELEDENDAIAEIPNLEDYIFSLPPVIINSTNVRDIPIESFEAMTLQLEEQLEKYKKNQDTMTQQMKEDRKNFKQLLEEMEVKEELKYQKEIEAEEKNFERRMDAMKAKLNDSEAQRRHEEKMLKMKQDHEAHMQQMDLQHQQKKEKSNKSNIIFWMVEKAVDIFVSLLIG